MKNPVIIENIMATAFISSVLFHLFKLAVWYNYNG